MSKLDQLKRPSSPSKQGDRTVGAVLYDEIFTEEYEQLNATRLEVRAARLGAADPVETLGQLEDSIIHASDVWDAHVGRPDAKLNELIYVEFLREHAKACAQWLELGQGHPRLPSRKVTHDLLTEVETRNLRLSMAEVINRCASRAIPILNRLTPHHPPLAIFALEFKVASLYALATATLEGASPGFGALPARQRARFDNLTTALLEERDRLLGLEDELELLPWCAGAVGRILVLMGDRSGFALLAQARKETHHDRHQLVDIAVSLLADPAQTATGDWLDDLNEVFAESGPAFSLARDGLLSRISPNIFGTIVTQVQVGNIAQSIVLLHAHHRWTFDTDWQAAVPVLHLVSSGLVVAAVLERIEGDPIGLAIDVPEDVFRVAWESIQAGNDGALLSLRRDLSRVIRPILMHPGLNDVERLQLNALGACSWWPWAALSSGGQPLLTRLELGWHSPTRGVRPESAPAHTLLVVDESIRSSRKVLKHFEGQSLPTHVILFDSGREPRGSVVGEVLSALGSAGRAVFFTHGASAVESVRDSGIPIGPSHVLTLEDIAAVDMSQMEFCVIVACESGRSNPFIAGRSLAHAFAGAGVDAVVSTLWSIWESLGLDFLVKFTRALEAEDANAWNVWRSIVARDHARFAPFICLGRPGSR